MSRAATALVDTTWTPTTLKNAWSPTIDSVVPVVRRAILVKHKPALTEQRTREVHDVIKAAWPEWRQRYLEGVAKAIGLSPSQLEIIDEDKEWVRYRHDGKTPMIDLPRVRTTSGRPFDLRHCIALCIDQMSSKIWTRLGLPEDEERAGSCDVGKVRDEVSRLRTLATKCDEWFYGELYRVAREAFANAAPRRGGILEVITIGLQIAHHADDDVYDDWLLRDHRGPNLENGELLDHLAAATDLASGEDFATQVAGDPNAQWLSISTAVRLASSELVPRTALYLVRPVGRVAQVLGIGLDDSARGELAALAAVKISRLLANRV
jgi:hypothetical protein